MSYAQLRRRLTEIGEHVDALYAVLGSQSPEFHAETEALAVDAMRDYEAIYTEIEVIS